MARKKKKITAKEYVAMVKEIQEHQRELDLRIDKLGKKIKGLPHDPTHIGGPAPKGRR